MKKRALAVMLAGVMVLGAQTGVWAASDTSDQKEGELTLLMTNSWIDESGASSEEFLKAITYDVIIISIGLAVQKRLETE